MALSADRLQEALRPWSFVDGQGREHVAKPMGFSDAMRWKDRLVRAAGNPWRQDHLVSAFIRTLFPWRTRYLLPNRLGGQPDPWKVFRDMPLPARRLVLDDFFGRAELLPTTPRTPRPQPSSNGSARSPATPSKLPAS